MLYTRKGDMGTTQIFAGKNGQATTFGCCNQRVSKSSAVAEALGALDEINSFLGVCKIKAENSRLKIKDSKIADIVNGVQQNLFIVQAELAGAEKTITKEKVEAVEEIIDGVEKELPPITTFFVSGGTELAATFDFARTVARRAERRVVEVNEREDRKIGEYTLAYLNRLSSLLYALARCANHKAGVVEEKPNYK